jgi:TRAP-type C4-dicarboxylate transport system substrate-binding protein
MKLNAKSAVATAVVGAVVLILAGCAGGGDGGDGDAVGASSEAEPITLIYASALPETTPQGGAEAAFMDYVEEHTEGQVTFERYFSGSLTPATEAISAIEAGLVDVSYAGPAFFPEQLPLNNWLTGLGAIPSGDNATFGHIQNMISTYEVLREFPEFDREYEDLGLHPLTPFSQQQAGIECTSEVTTPEQAAGKTVSATTTWTSEMAALGFSTTYIPFVDIYEALQRGVLDCFVVPVGAIYAAKHYEVAPFFMPLEVRAAISLVRPVMSLEKWNALSDDVRTIFDEAELYAMQVFLEKDMAANATMIADPDGFTVTPAPELDAVLESAKEESVDSMIENAPAGVEDPEAVLAFYESELAEWSDALDALGAVRVGPLEWPEGIAAGPDQPYPAAFEELADQIGLAAR